MRIARTTVVVIGHQSADDGVHRRRFLHGIRRNSQVVRRIVHVQNRNIKVLVAIHVRRSVISASYFDFVLIIRRRDARLGRRIEQRRELESQRRSLYIENVVTLRMFDCVFERVALPIASAQTSDDRFGWTVFVHSRTRRLNIVGRIVDSTAVKSRNRIIIRPLRGALTLNARKILIRNGRIVLAKRVATLSTNKSQFIITGTLEIAVVEICRCAGWNDDFLARCSKLIPIGTARAIRHVRPSAVDGPTRRSSRQVITVMASTIITSHRIVAEMSAGTAATVTATFVDVTAVVVAIGIVSTVARAAAISAYLLTSAVRSTASSAFSQVRTAAASPLRPTPHVAASVLVTIAASIATSAPISPAYIKKKRQRPLETQKAWFSQTPFPFALHSPFTSQLTGRHQRRRRRRQPSLSLHRDAKATKARRRTATLKRNIVFFFRTQKPSQSNASVPSRCFRVEYRTEAGTKSSLSRAHVSHRPLQATNEIAAIFRNHVKICKNVGGDREVTMRYRQVPACFVIVIRAVYRDSIFGSLPQGDPLSRVGDIEERCRSF